MPVTVSAHVNINLSGLKKFRRAIRAQLHGTQSGPIRDAINQWGIRYRGWSQQRFVRYSRGGGNWPPLKRKRRRGGKSEAAILRDTGILFASLNPIFNNNPGGINQHIPFGVKVGYGGSSSHGKGTATISDIASYHQTGAGVLPVRKIIDTPPSKVTSGMAKDMERAFQKLSNAI